MKKPFLEPWYYDDKKYDKGCLREFFTEEDKLSEESFVY